MKILLIAIAAGLLTFGGDLKDKAFPELIGQTLEDQTITLPADTKGKVTIVGMAYSKKAEATLKTWYQPMYDKFVLKRGMFDNEYDVNFYFVPMFVGAKQAAYNKALKNMKESNRKDLYPYILYYKGKLAPYDEELNMDDKNLPYLFVLDEEGNIEYRTKGLYQERKMEAIEEVLDKRL